MKEEIISQEFRMKNTEEIKNDKKIKIKRPKKLMSKKRKNTSTILNFSDYWMCFNFLFSLVCILIGITGSAVGLNFFLQ